MTAPALIALAHGSRDPRSAQTITALVDEVKAMRPDLRVEKAFLDLSKPSFQTVVDRLVR
jgi:sirohydrochlorin ferrochelatase